MNKNTFYGNQPFILSNENKFVLTMDSNKILHLIPIDDNFIEKTYVNDMVNHLCRNNKDNIENLLDNYKFFIDFYYEKEKIILKDNYIKKTFSISIPKEKATELESYAKEKIKVIKNYLKNLKDDTEKFSWENNMLYSPIWLENLNIDLFVTSITYVLNEKFKERNMTKKITNEKTIELLKDHKYVDKKSLTLDYLFTTSFC